ncbi:hypothetical protein ACU4GD_14900 [Cupriavidus basilensis]
MTPLTGIGQYTWQLSRELLALRVTPHSLSIRTGKPAPACTALRIARGPARKASGCAPRAGCL